MAAERYPCSVATRMHFAAIPVSVGATLTGTAPGQEGMSQAATVVAHPAARCALCTSRGGTGPDRSAPSCRIRLSLHHSLKVDISLLHIRADQLHPEPVADVHAFKTALQSSFNGRMQKTDPRTFVRCTGDDGIELLTDS